MTYARTGTGIRAFEGGAHPDGILFAIENRIIEGHTWNPFWPPYDEIFTRSSGVVLQILHLYLYFRASSYRPGAGASTHQMHEVV